MEDIGRFFFGCVAYTTQSGAQRAELHWRKLTPTFTRLFASYSFRDKSGWMTYRGRFIDILKNEVHPTGTVSWM